MYQHWIDGILDLTVLNALSLKMDRSIWRGLLHGRLRKCLYHGQSVYHLPHPTNHLTKIVVTNSIYDFGKIQFCYYFGASIVWVLDYFIIINFFYFYFLEKVVGHKFIGAEKSLV